MKNKRSEKQAGVALITAMLVVALAATASVSITSNYRLNLHRTESTFSSGQAWAYAKGAEEWAKAILARDRKDSQANYDAYDEAWWNDGEALVFPLSDGYIEGKIEDAQSKLNINSLLNEGKVNESIKARFERLFAILEIDVALVGALIDWIDSDQQFTGSLGAETDIYIGLNPPYLPADQPMEDISELRLVYGISDEMYKELLPHITALPNTNSVLNINTASAELLETLAANAPAGIGQELVEERLENPFRQVNELIKRFQDRGLVADINNSPIGVGTNHFVLHTTCVIGKSQVRIKSVIYRGGGNNLQVIKRSQTI